jgi:succinate dehydrogenase / fumarate reductase cytochrome b subunit
MSNNSHPGFTTATVGKKVLMAVSGFIFIGFVIAHLIGNLQLFIGQEQLNKYAETLQNLGALKWGFRIFLLAFFGIHIWKGFVLWLENKKARPVSYAKEESIQASISSRTMIYTGGMIFFFVLYHLLHFTTHSTNPEYLQLPLVDGRFDVYSMVIIGFTNPLISIVYIIAVFLMAFHLSHAISSMFQTIGLNSPKAMPRLTFASNLIALVVFLGYVSMPLAVLFEFIKLPGGGY